MKLPLRSFIAATLFAWFTAATSFAHCDTLGGPVVEAARSALVSADVAPVLKWVRPDDEAAIRAAFAQAIVVRKQSPDAAQLADLWFFETVVRIHRSGEGEPYTGLKPASAVSPSARSADQALATASVETLADSATESLRTKLHGKFERALRLRAHASDSVEAGREYVAEYIDYVHFAEKLLDLGAETDSAHHEH